MKSCPNAAARWSVSAIFFIFGALVGGWIPHIPDVKRALDIPNSTLGFALLASGFGATLTMPITGAVVHRFGSRHVLLIAAAFACLVLPWLVLEPSTIALMANLFVLGIFYGFLDVAMNAHSVAVQARHDRPILSSVHGFFSIGGFAGSAGAALADRVSLSPFAHLWLNSIAMLIVLACSSGFLLSTEADKGVEGPKFVIPHGILLVLGMLCLFAFMSEGGLLDWTALYLRSNLKSSAEIGAVGVAMVNFAMAAGRFGGDRVVAAAGYRRVLFGSGLVAAFGIIAGVLTGSPALTIALFALAAIGISNVVPILFAAAGNIQGIPAGVGLAAVSTCGYAGFLLGPPTLGNLADFRGLGFSLATLGVLGLASAAMSKAAVRGMDGA